MRKALLAAVVASLTLVGAVGVDECGYRHWRSSFEAAANKLALSPSAWDGKARSKSFDPAAYSLVLTLKPSRFEKRSAKAVSALVFEPPWYVWSYWAGTRSQTSYAVYDRFFRSDLASRLHLRPRNPCQMAFSSTGMEAHCGWQVVVAR